MKTESVDVKKIYDDAIVIDCAAPALMQDMREWRRYYDAGVTAILATVVTADDMPATIDKLSRFHDLIRRNDELLLIETVDDFKRAKDGSKLGIGLHFQNARPLGRDAGMVEIFERLGVRVIQLCYNYRNNLGDGCLEPGNGGLSEFGRNAVARMNEHNVLVDLSHTGVQTTLDAMEHSSRPDVFTHSNARGVHDHPRNLTDDQIRAVAEKGGVIGLCSFPDFITNRTNKPSVDDLLAHLDYMVDKVGIGHVGLGTDFFHGDGWASNVELGNWRVEEYPPPPWHYPLDGSNTVDLVAGMSRRGYTTDDINKVLGANFERVFADVWSR